MSWLLCCSRPKVTTLRVLDYNRSGLDEVPPTVFSHERTLEVLLLDANNITELPRLLFQLEELKVLNLGDNDISILPGAVGELRLLEKLYLQRNCLLYSTVHQNLKLCNKLTILDLSSNSLERVPDAISCIVSLQELYLNDTGIDFLPAIIGRLYMLRILELRDNNLSILPKSLHRLESLQRLDVGNNELTELADVVGKLTNIRELWLDSNNITNISNEIDNLQKLVHFDISNNQIESIPEEIGAWQRCIELDLSNNLIEAIPSSIGNLRALQTLKLDENQIKKLPLSIGRCFNLEEIAIQYNYLIELPQSIGYLRKLRIMILAKNKITLLPTEIGSCVSLSVLNLHGNLLTKLPEEIGHLYRLTCINLVDNRLKYLPVSLGRLPNLSALWLSSNQSTPLIPLQNERLNQLGPCVLTCYLLPQTDKNWQHKYEPNRNDGGRETGRHIAFEEPNKIERPGRLTRSPTPFPKDYERYQKSLLAKRGVHNLNRYDVEIKEAKVTTSPRVSDAIQALDLARKPPPYHIAALFSKHAHKFNNVESPDISLPESYEGDEPPKSFTQELPPCDSFIHAPRPHRPTHHFHSHRITPILVKDTCVPVEGPLPEGGFATIVWIHPGNFTIGSPAIWNPYTLVYKQRVIVVTFAYRLNIFGFLSTMDGESPGNFGLMDQQAALKWVRGNVKLFGGNPDNICLLGYGAGATSIGIHMVSPQSKGLFHKAIAMSGNLLSPSAVKQPHDDRDVVDKAAEYFACYRKPTSALLDCLRRADVNALTTFGASYAWKPIIDQSFTNSTGPPAVLIEAPKITFERGDFHKVPFLTGYTNMEDVLALDSLDTKSIKEDQISEEFVNTALAEFVTKDLPQLNNTESCVYNYEHVMDSVLFFYGAHPPTRSATVARKIVVDFTTEKNYGSTAFLHASYVSKHQTTYVYRFDMKLNTAAALNDIPEWVSVPHLFDLVYVWGIPYWGQLPDLQEWDYRDKRTADLIMLFWTNFAKYSNPTENSVYPIVWEPFTRESPGILIIDRTFNMTHPDQFNYKAFEFWNNYYPKVLELATQCCNATDSSGDAAQNEFNTCLLLVASVFFLLQLRYIYL